MVESLCASTTALLALVAWATGGRHCILTDHLKLHRWILFGPLNNFIFCNYFRVTHLMKGFIFALFAMKPLPVNPFFVLFKYEKIRIRPTTFRGFNAILRSLLC